MQLQYFPTVFILVCALNVKLSSKPINEVMVLETGFRNLGKLNRTLNEVLTLSLRMIGDLTGESLILNLLREILQYEAPFSLR